jgi:hypothetical protein
MQSRRDVLVNAAQVAAALIGARPAHATAREYAPFYTADSAPDALSRAILSRKLMRIDQGSAAGADVTTAIHRNVPQLLEQNFAALDVPRMSRMLANLQRLEWDHLATLYMDAIATPPGKQPYLLDILALRLSAQQLATLTPHFGTTMVRAAVSRSAPAKLKAMLVETGGVQLLAPPRPGRQLGPSAGPVTNAGAGPYLNLTPYEIYLSFRTAPVGALGVTGALYESTMLISGQLVLAYGIGYAVGSMITPLIQTYAPSLWDTIGGVLYGIVQNMSSALDTFTLGAAQFAGSASFDLGSTAQLMQSTGGDFGVANPWNTWAGSVGCGGCHR